MVWPFNRNSGSSSSNVPPEVADYYESERKSRINQAWLMSAIAFVVTVLVVLGLFFGGRWVYRAVFDNNDTNTEVVEQPPAQEESANGGGNSSDDEAQNDANRDDNAAEQAPGEGDRPISPSPESGTTNQNGTPTTGDDIPNTGPAENAAVFISSTVLFAVAYNFALRRKFAKQ